MTSLVFNENSLSAEFVTPVGGMDFYIVFTVTDTGIENIEEYLAGVEYGTVVSGYSARNPNGGALINGVMYYTNSDPIQFTTDSVICTQSNIVGIITLNFAYTNVPLIQNSIFGGAKLTYTLASPYIHITIMEDNTLHLEPISNQLTDVLPTIQVYPYPNTCFAKGTNILTPNGYKLIENLNKDDEIIIVLNNIRTVRKIECIYSYETKNPNNLFCLPSNSLNPNHPNKDLYLSGGHAIRIDGKYRHIKCLFKHNKNIPLKKIESTHTKYFHIKIQNWHDGDLIANQIKCETYYGNNQTTKMKWLCNEKICSNIIIKENN